MHTESGRDLISSTKLTPAIITRPQRNGRYFRIELHSPWEGYPGISLADTITAIHNWSERKTKLFKDEYIQIAYNHLDTFRCNQQELF